MTIKESISKLEHYRNIRNAFNSIRNYCYNPNTENFKYYGAKGIKICDLWLDEEYGIIYHYIWAIQHGYKKGSKIERKNKNSDFRPDECYVISKEDLAKKKSALKKKEGKTKSIKSINEAKLKADSKQSLTLVKNDVVVFSKDNLESCLKDILLDMNTNKGQISDSKEIIVSENIKETVNSIDNGFVKNIIKKIFKIT